MRILVAAAIAGAFSICGANDVAHSQLAPKNCKPPLIMNCEGRGCKCIDPFEPGGDGVVLKRKGEPDVILPSPPEHVDDSSAGANAAKSGAAKKSIKKKTD
jgi:hypothetical protein